MATHTGGRVWCVLMLALLPACSGRLSAVEGNGVAGAGDLDGPGLDGEGPGGSRGPADGSGQNGPTADNDGQNANSPDGEGPSSGADPSNGNQPGVNIPAGTSPSDLGNPTAPVACNDGGVQLGSAPSRRLSNREYLNTLGELFPGLAPELPELPVEDPVDSFDNDARALGASDVAVSRWEEIAFRYTNALMQDTSLLGAVLPCFASVSGRDSARACGREWVESFGLSTHRRPLTDAERERYQALFEQQLEAIDFEAAVQLTAVAMLQSPWFLYRLEVTEAGANASDVPLDSWQMASRLSFFLWQRMPDRELFDAAANDELASEAGIERQVRRMLDDPRGRAGIVDFHRQWLYFDRILHEEHDSRLPSLYPDWTAYAQQSAYEELLRFVERSVFDGGGTLSDLLLSTEVEVDRELAAIYGVEGPTQQGEWIQTQLPAAERAGLLTRVGFLAAHAHSGNGSPPLRGSYIMQRLFCLPPIPPPPDANTTPPETTGTALTNREAFEVRTTPGECRGCHDILDGFGFGFEHYDAVGAYRDLDNGQPVDAVVTLVGTDITGEIDGAIEMSQRFAESEQVAACAVSRWFRYSRGRGLEAVDRCALDRLNARFAASGGNLIELMVDLVKSPEFRQRPVGALEE